MPSVLHYSASLNHNHIERWEDKGSNCQAMLSRLYVSKFMSSEKRAGRSLLHMKVTERVAKACQLTQALLQVSPKMKLTSFQI